MDPITFVFLLTTWSPDVPHAVVDVMDAGISGSDCIQRMEDYNTKNPTWANGNPSCEIDLGDWEESASHGYAVPHNGDFTILYPCAYEDSNNCLWDARWRGNGEGTGNGTGTSFYVINDVVTYIAFGEHDEFTPIK